MKPLIGTWTNAACGTVVLNLTRCATIGSSAHIAPHHYRFDLDSDGTLSPGRNIWGNDQLSPQGTGYHVVIYDRFGQAIWGPQTLQLCGAKWIDLNKWIHTCEPTITGITVSPSSVSLNSGQTQQFTVSGASGTVSWSASQGTITSGGLFTAPTVTTTTQVTVTAVSGSQTGSASVTVNPSGTTGITISPATASLNSGQTLQFSVSGTTGAVAWSASQGNITSGGLFTAPTVTTSTQVTVTVTSGGQTATANVTVNPSTTTGLSISPSSATLNSFQTQQLSVSGNLGTPAWAATAGSINASGLFTAHQVAQTETVTVTVSDPIRRASASATVTVNPVTGQLDLLNWMGLANHMQQHLEATQGQHGTAVYFAIDTDSNYPTTFPKGTFWYVKNVAGNPWDVCFYDNNFALMHWITEDGDPGVDQTYCISQGKQSCWDYPYAYKRFTTGLRIIPRFYNPNGGPVTIQNPGPNTVIRTTDCEVGATTPVVNISLGDVKAITSGPYNMSWGGDIDKGPGSAANGTGTIDNVNGVPTIKNEYYLSGQLSLGNWADLEITYYVQGFGRVAWFEYKDPSRTGNWGLPTNSDVNTRKVAGGLPQLTFPCGPGKSWFVHGGGGEIIPPGVSVTISPQVAAMQVGQAQFFNAIVLNAANINVNWSVTGGGTVNPTTGTATTYTAPASVPSPATVTLTATSQQDSSASASNSITITAGPPPPQPDYFNLEAKTPWAFAGPGGMDQGVSQPPQSNTLQVNIDNGVVWGEVRAWFPSNAANAWQLPLPPDGLVTLDGMIFVNRGFDAIGNITLDTIIAKNNQVFHMGWQIDYTDQVGTLRIQDASQQWVSTGIVVGPLSTYAWHTFRIEMSINTTAGTAQRIAFSLDGNRQTVPGGVAGLTPYSESWMDGVTLQVGLASNAAGIGFSADYVNLGYTYG